MTVWILAYVFPAGGYDILGVYSSSSKAIGALADIKINGHDRYIVIEWGVS